MAGLHGSHRGQQGLEREQLAAKGGKPVGERRPLPPRLGQDPVPALGPDRVGVPDVRGTFGGVRSAVQRGERDPDPDRIDHRVGLVHVDPALDPDQRAGDVVAVATVSGGHGLRGRHPLLPGETLELAGPLGVGGGKGLVGPLDRPDAALGVQPPHLTLLAAGGRAAEVDHRTRGRTRRRWLRRSPASTRPTMPCQRGGRMAGWHHTMSVATALERVITAMAGPEARPRADQASRGRGAGRAPPAGAGRAGHRLGQVGGLLGGDRGAAGRRGRADAGRLAAAGADAGPDRGRRAGRAASGHGQLDQLRRVGRRCSATYARAGSTCC